MALYVTKEQLATAFPGLVSGEYEEYTLSTAQTAELIVLATRYGRYQLPGEQIPGRMLLEQAVTYVRKEDRSELSSVNDWYVQSNHSRLINTRRDLHRHNAFVQAVVHEARSRRDHRIDNHINLALVDLRGQVGKITLQTFIKAELYDR
jgi:hypothetical protein